MATRPTPAPGPSPLGRGVIVDAGAPTPCAWSDAPRIVVDDAVLGDPSATVARLHRHWLRREPVVVELTVDSEVLRTPTTTDVPAHRLGVDHSIDRDRLAFLVWANNYDARSGVPVWWHGVIATRRTPVRPADDGGDVLLADGSALWIDGGPHEPVDGLRLAHRESLTLGRLTQLDAVGIATSPPRQPTPEHPPRSARLAPDQLAAVLHRGGPARVIAPAGSGKTRVLSDRIRQLLRRGVEPELITAVAYNTRAAAEMRERIAAPQLSVRTLNSLGLWICSLDRRRDVITERDVRSILGGLVDAPRIPNQDPWQPWIEALSRVRLGLVDPHDVEASSDDVDGFAEVFDRYRRLLDDRGVLDFDEQIFRALELLLGRPDIRARVQHACTHLLVDEFQDLTPAHLLLIRLAAGPAMQVFAVGDDDQTIYGYVGASPRWLVDFERWFPGAASHALEVNYRCPAAVVDAADNLLSHNVIRIDKAIRASEHAAEARGVGDELVIHRVAAARAVDLLVDLVGSDAGASTAVLARAVSVLLPVQVALTDAGVGHNAPLDASVLERTGIRTALAYLRIAASPGRIERADLVDTVNRPTRKIKTAVGELLRARRFDLAGLRRLRRQLDASHRDRFDAYLADLHGLSAAVADGATTAECLRIVRHDIGLGAAMEKLDESRARPEGSSHTDDLDALAQIADRQRDPRTFESWLRSRLDGPASADGVTLSTVHRVKGLEWDRVVVFGANAGLFPHRRADDAEEERRIFHVALTRCRRRVDVVADRDRASPFLAELTRRAPSAPPQPSGTEASAPQGTEDVGDERSDDEVFEALRHWRRRTATELGVPAYLIFHDRHLRDIAARRPRTATALADCPGVGPRKLERFGSDVLEVTAP